ncbi:MAG: hypothetical protein NVS3B6_17740 [Pseudarthrobacter sp.]
MEQLGYHWEDLACCSGKLEYGVEDPIGSPDADQLAGGPPARGKAAAGIP